MLTLDVRDSVSVSCLRSGLRVQVIGFFMPSAVMVLSSARGPQRIAHPKGKKGRPVQAVPFKRLMVSMTKATGRTQLHQLH